MFTRDEIGFRENGMTVISAVYKHKTRETARVLPGFRTLEEKPYMVLVVCIDDGITMSSRLAVV
jgi:hypothetical protein